MKCVNCSNEQDSGKFCGKCGTPLQAVEGLEVEVDSQVQTETAATAANESIAEPVMPPVTSTAPLVTPVGPAQSNGGGNIVKEFLHFDKMITPSIIKFIFWIGSGLAILMGLIQMVGGIFGDGGMLVFLGLLTILIGPIFVRIYCELLILLFKIHESLQSLSEKNKFER